MVAVNEQNAIRKLRQRIQLVIIMPSEAKDTAEVACDDKHIFLCQAILHLDFSKTVYIAVGIACNVDHRESLS